MLWLDQDEPPKTQLKIVHQLNPTSRQSCKQTLPVELCELAIRNRKAPELRLYLYLKFNHSGYIVLSRGIFQEIALGLRVSDKTVRTHFNNLLKLKWVTGNRRAKTYKVVSYKRIAQRYKFHSTKVCYIQDRHLNKLTFRTLLWAVVIGYWSQYRKGPKREMFRKRPGKGSTCSTTHAKESLPRFRPLANKYIEKVLGIPHSTIVKYKGEANSLGYITVRQMYEETGVGSMDLGMYKESNPEKAHLMRINRDCWVVICLPSEIRPELQYKNCRRLKNGKKWTQ